jgi:nicotinate-nucleotide adenylyltransferase
MTMPTQQRVSRLGVLGGTFDPPHYGHLLLADTARVQLGLECVLFAPAGQPPHKPGAQPTAVAHRVALVEAALADAGEPTFRLSRVDVDRPGPHFTADSLEILSQAYPEAALWFLIGADSLADLAKWRSPDRIIALGRLGVLPRPGYEPDLQQLAARLEVRDLRERIDWLMGPSLDVSSTALRERVRCGVPLRFLVPPTVEAYVRCHHLYQEEH